MVEICDTLDYTRLYDEYLRHWRAIDPVVMFEILVFAYMNRIYSSRGIEKAWKTDVRFMWLLQGESAPDHATFARFQNERLTDVIEDLFVQLVMKLHELGEIKFRNVFIDGTKIEANANRYPFAAMNALLRWLCFCFMIWYSMERGLFSPIILHLSKAFLSLLIILLYLSIAV